MLSSSPNNFISSLLPLRSSNTLLVHLEPLLVFESCKPFKILDFTGGIPAYLRQIIKVDLLKINPD